jgi:DUF4097 and DUF4098 domain-containing protein YvlB
VWIVLMTALLALVDLSTVAPAAMADVSDRQARVLPLPANKSLSIDITIGAVRIEGWDRPEVSITIDRRAPTASGFERLPVVIDDTPERVSVKAIQTNGTTDPALRTDVSVRVPRAAVLERVNVLEGRIVVEGFSGTLTADIRRGPIDGKDLSGTLRLEAGIGSVTLLNTRLSPGGLLRLRSFNGDVRLTLAQRPADARIMALALNGQVMSDIPLTHRNTWGPRWAEATLGTGAPVISLDVVTGVIELKSP